MQKLLMKERMSKVCVCCTKGEVEVEMKLEQGSSSHSSSSSSSSKLRVESSQQYAKSLKGMQKIALVTDLTAVCNWFLGFCALTWASAVLLGAYIENLSKWDYYDVSLLLFVEGLRFGLAAFLRLLGYRLSNFARWSLQSVAFSLPLGMGGFAVLSILPDHVRRRIHDRFTGRSTPPAPPTFDVAPPPYDSPYRSLTPSREIFYALVLLNAFILLLGSSVTGLMRQRYVKPNVRSLCKYHDKMMDSTSTSWLRPAVDLNFAFQIQASQYRKGDSARDVCKKNTDLIWYLYTYDKGVGDAVEAALAAEDRYMQQAAANIIGFWAILEAEVEVQAAGLKSYPLCFQREMLSKLADIAAESYGSLSAAAARSFALLLKSVDPKLIGLVANVRGNSSGKDLIEILLSRAAELLHPRYHVPQILQQESHAHIYALSEYLCYLQSASKWSDTVITSFIGAQREQLVQKIRDVTGGSDNEESLNDKLSKLLPCIEPDDHEKYDSDIKSYLTADPSQLPNYSPSVIKATFILLFNVAVPLVCLGVGFIVSALL